MFDGGKDSGVEFLHAGSKPAVSIGAIRVFEPRRQCGLGLVSLTYRLVLLAPDSSFEVLHAGSKPAVSIGAILADESRVERTVTLAFVSVLEEFGLGLLGAGFEGADFVRRGLVHPFFLPLRIRSQWSTASMSSMGAPTRVN